MKKEVLSILGSTGSIGNNTVDVVSNNLDKFSVYKINNENFDKSRYNDNKDYKFVYSKNYKFTKRS